MTFRETLALFTGTHSLSRELHYGKVMYQRERRPQFTLDFRETYLSWCRSEPMIGVMIYSDIKHTQHCHHKHLRILPRPQEAELETVMCSLISNKRYQCLISPAELTQADGKLLCVQRDVRTYDMNPLILSID